MCQNRKNASVLFDNMVLYPNSFMTITSKEYTKHYYMNGERLASSIGGGGLCAMSPDVISNAETHHEKYLFNTLDIYKNAYPYEYPEEEMPQLTQNVDIRDIFYNDLQYLCPMRRLQQIELKCDPDILYAVIDGNCDIHDAEIDVFYRHSDHLSSANWITDVNGYAIQYIHYLPYGQVLKNQMAGSYDERYKFTGKERDEDPL